MKKEKPTKKKEDSAEIKDLLLRTQANFENYRKQTEKRIEEIRQMASRNLIIQLLPVLDNFELALKTANTQNKDFLQGIELIYSQLNSVLSENGVKKIEEKKMFDPNFHEALMKIESDQPEETILETLQNGYTLHDKMIRVARVKISAGKNNNQIKEKQ